MKKRLQPIDLPPHLEEFRKNYLAATEVEATLCGIITCYKMYGAYFIRTKSSLTGKRVQQDKRFARTRHNASILAEASAWVSPVYNSLTEDWHCHDLYRKLVGLGVKLLHQGATKATLQQTAWDELARLGYKTVWPQWELPPELEKWREEDRKSGSREDGKKLESREDGPDCYGEGSPEVGEPVFGEQLTKEGNRRAEYLSSEDEAISVARGMGHEQPVHRWIVNEKGELVQEVAMPPPMTWINKHSRLSSANRAGNPLQHPFDKLV